MSLSPLQRLHHLERHGIRLGLDRVKLVAASLNLLNPESTILHVAGTNGKGSVCAIVDSLLRAHGFRVGRFISPHLHDFSERFSVNGDFISGESLDRLINVVLDRSEELNTEITFFEAATLIALLYFKEQKVDFSVLEIGMGGRLDATNIVNSKVVALPSIGLDHTEWLGKSEGEIAREKCGVLQYGSTLISGPLSDEAEAAVREEVERLGCIWRRWGDSFSFGEDLTYRSGDLAVKVPRTLPGKFQMINSGVAIATLESLLPSLNDKMLADGFAKVEWPGRFEQIASSPPVWLDVAHNPAGIRALLDGLPDIDVEFYFAASRGKDIENMCEQLFARGNVSYLNIPHVRLLSEDEFRASFPSLIGRISGWKNLTDIRLAGRKKAILFCGSIFMIDKVRAFLNTRGGVFL